MDEAELRGDVLEALDLIEADLTRRGGAAADNFWNAHRLLRLMQIRLFGPDLPGWAVSRWILAQGAQWLDPQGGGRMRKAIDVAIRTRGDRFARHANDPLDVRCQVMDYDWVCRQVYLYELGGLRVFLASGVPADTMAGADRIHEWASSSMGGFRVVTTTPRTITWAGLATGEETETANLGAAALHEEGDCAIGRMVPIEGGQMFESAPLFVPDQVARKVASEPADWLEHLAAGCREPQEEGRVIWTDLGHDFGILTDMSASVLEFAALEEWARAEERGETPAEPWDLAVTHFLLVVLRNGIDASELDCWEIDPWPAVGAALVDPHVLMHVAEELNEADAGPLRELARVLPSPGSGVCLLLAEELRLSA